MPSSRQGRRSPRSVWWIPWTPISGFLAPKIDRTSGNA
jgi:hypothetical protein